MHTAISDLVLIQQVEQRVAFLPLFGVEQRAQRSKHKLFPSREFITDHTAASSQYTAAVSNQQPASGQYTAAVSNSTRHTAHSLRGTSSEQPDGRLIQKHSNHKVPGQTMQYWTCLISCCTVICQGPTECDQTVSLRFFLDSFCGLPVEFSDPSAAHSVQSWL